MPKMSVDKLRAIIGAQRDSAMSAMQASKLSDDRSRALNYYLGDETLDGDMPVYSGRSKAVSSDVADTIEGLMPQLMDIFTSSEDVVQFQPVGPEDEAAADQETDYVNHVFMNVNPGFMILYKFIKDALLSKVGVVKVIWLKEDVEEEETFMDLTDDQLAMIAADPSIQIVEHTIKDAGSESASGY